MDGSPFNPDELAAQVLAGGGPRGNGIRDFMPEQHRHFFAQLPYLFLGLVDAAGWPLATLLTGHPGFVQSPDSVTLYIAALPDVGDPAAEALAPDRDIGILGIDFSTRRRNRANGRIQSLFLGACEFALKPITRLGLPAFSYIGPRIGALPRPVRPAPDERAAASSRTRRS